MGWFKSAPLAVSMIGHATLLAGAALVPARSFATPGIGLDTMLMDAPRVEAEPEDVTPPAQEAPRVAPSVKPSPMEQPRPAAQLATATAAVSEPVEPNPYDDPDLLVTTQAPALVRAGQSARRAATANETGTSTHSRPPTTEKRAASPTSADVDSLFHGWESRVHGAVRRVAGQSYSREARRRGSVGTVVLSMEVDPAGHVKLVRVARSSGHRELDQAAVAAVQSLGSVPAPPREAHALLRPLTIPIAYRLE